MKLTQNEWLCGAGRQMRQRAAAVVLTAIGLLGQMAGAQAISTTTVQGTVFLANGQAGSGTLYLSWPAFTTANGLAVAADSMNVAIAPDGFVSVTLTPNLGATPAGLYYTAVFYMSDGTTSTQYWVVPSAAQASLAQVQSQVDAGRSGGAGGKQGICGPIDFSVEPESVDGVRWNAERAALSYR